VTPLIRRLNALFQRDVKTRLLLVLAGSLTIAMAEAVAILAVLPLMALVTGATPRSSRELRFLHDLFGQPSQERLAVYVALLVLAGFILKVSQLSRSGGGRSASSWHRELRRQRSCCATTSRPRTHSICDGVLQTCFGF
jgi:hypothetical protein